MGGRDKTDGADWQEKSAICDGRFSANRLSNCGERTKERPPPSPISFCLFEGAHHICVLLQLSDGLVDIIAPDGAGTAKALELLSVFSQWDIGAHVFPRANCYVFFPRSFAHENPGRRHAGNEGGSSSC
jgi:hypothetical protein